MSNKLKLRENLPKVIVYVEDPESVVTHDHFPNTNFGSRTSTST